MEWRHEVRLTRNGGSIVSYLESIFSLRGKNALVTGAASGLRRRCAVVLPQAGARVALVDVNQAGLAETAATIGHAVALPADVTRSDEVGRMLTNAVETPGQIDIVVTCAGVALWKPALEVPEEEFELGMSPGFAPRRNLVDKLWPVYPMGHQTSRFDVCPFIRRWPSFTTHI
jgi:NAD(P)-dependent dehydrogenase (short-subunit alcohol dehydrogenase family)